MKKWIRYSLTGLLAAVLTGTAGCGSSMSVLPAEEEQNADAEDSGKSGTDEDIREGSDTGTGQESENGSGREEDLAGNGEDSGSGDDREADTDASDGGTDQDVKMIYVDVAGAVCSPGVYTLPEGSRVFQAIEKAGGFADDAHRESMNQAGLLEDGQQIRVYTREEAELLTARGQVPQTVLSGEGGETSPETSPSGNGSDGGAKVNLNTADKEELMTLTGIGETRAEAILDYREENGGFRSAEDLMQVEGIKEKTYEKLKDQITVD